MAENNFDPFVPKKRWLTPLSIFGLAAMGAGLIFLVYPLVTAVSYHLAQAADSAGEYEQIPDLEFAEIFNDGSENNDEDFQLKSELEAEVNQPTQAVAPTAAQSPAPALAKNLVPTPTINKIIILKIGVEMKIVEGESEKALYQGAWHLPGTSTPDRGGNTVISAHRYLYRPPSSKTFYLLDKLAAGDIVKIIWDGMEYQYQVREVKIVEPEQVEILANTAKPILTLFTCTPLFTSEKRLVVVADLIL